MELYVFNKNLEFQGIIDTYTSFIWVRRYQQNGEFELHCDLTEMNLKLLKKENIIWKKEDDEAGYIEYRNLIENSNGSESLVIKGKFLTAYLNRRLVWSNENLNLKTEIAMRTLVDKNCINPVDSNRVISKLSLSNLKGYSHEVNYPVNYTNLYDEIENLSNLSELGFKIKVDISNKKLLFDVYKGLDRSINQAENPRCIFSKEFENILEQSYVDSLNNFRNLALVGGKGEGADRKFATVGTSIGLDRFEIFVNEVGLTNPLDNNGSNVILTDEEYTKLLIEKGNSTLAEYKEVKTFESKINIDSNLIYKQNFDLGDVVTCISKKWGITVDTRITEIEEVYEQNKLSINVTFGNNIPTLIDKIRRKLR